MNLDPSPQKYRDFFCLPTSKAQSVTATENWLTELVFDPRQSRPTCKNDFGEMRGCLGLREKRCLAGR